MESVEFYSYFLLFFSFIAIWVFDNKLFGGITLLTAAILALHSEIITIFQGCVLLLICLNLWLLGKRGNYAFYLWISAIILIWLNFTNNLTTQLSVFDGLWIFNDEEIYNFLLNNYMKIFIAILICIFSIKPVGKILEAKLLAQKAAKIYFASLALFAFIFSISPYFIFEPYLPNYWALWLITNFLVVSMTEETFFRFLIQNNLNQFSKNHLYGQSLTIFTSALIYSTSFYFESSFLFLLIFLKGLCLGYIYNKCRRIEVSAALNTSISILNIFIFNYIN